MIVSVAVIAVVAAVAVMVAGVLAIMVVAVHAVAIAGLVQVRLDGPLDLLHREAAVLQLGDVVVEPLLELSNARLINLPRIVDLQ